MQGTTHVFKLSLPGQGEGTPPHLAAAAMSAAERKAFRPVKVVAAGRARGASLLNGSIPGSAAASAAVSLYNGTAGDHSQAALLYLMQTSPLEGKDLLSPEKGLRFASR
jgi:hypothetical protein